MSEKTLDLTVDEWMGMYHIAADRADKAEAEVKGLQTLLETFNGECVVCDSVSEIAKVQAENAKLRAVVEATKQFMNELDFRGKTHSLDMSNYHGRTIHIKQGESGKPYWLALWSLQQALAELDEEGRGMKYPNWNEYDSAKKWKAVADEVNLETNNATTKADLTNMVKFLVYEAVHLQAEVYKAEEVYERVAGLANCRKLVGNSAPVTNKFLNELCDFWEAR